MVKIRGMSKAENFLMGVNGFGHCLTRNSVAPGLVGAGWSDRLAHCCVRLRSDLVSPNSRVPLHVGDSNDGNASLSLNKKYSIRKTTG